jgi:putative Mn2+ efflux pump MntP
MTIWDIILIGLAMAMDASAVTIANCTTCKTKLSLTKEWSMPVTFSLFQILMPIIGFYLGSLFTSYLSGTDYIVAVVFFVLGLKVILDGIKEHREKGECPINPPEVSYATIIIQGVATSIDALIIGVTLSMSFASPFLPCLIIGAVTFATVSIALLLGKYLGHILGEYSPYIGAIILFGLSIKSLLSGILG